MHALCEWRVLEALYSHKAQLTTAPSTTARLEELVVRYSRDFVAWSKDADLACERALEAYELARGKDTSVVPQEDR